MAGSRALASLTAMALVAGAGLFGVTSLTVDAPPAQATAEFSCESDQGYAYFVNEGSGTVSMVYTGTDQVVAIIATNNEPYGVGVTPDGTKVYVSGALGVQVFNTTDFIARPVTGTFNRPVSAASSPDGTKMFIGNYGTNTVSVISTADDSELAVITLPNGTGAGWMDVDPGTGLIWVASDFGNRVYAIDPATNSVVQIIETGAGNHAVTVGDGYVWTVSNQFNDMVVRRYEIATGNPAGTVTVPSTVNGRLHGIAYDPDTGYLVIPGTDGAVRIVDGTAPTMTFAQTLVTEGNPSGDHGARVAVISPFGEIYVAAMSSWSVDGSLWTINKVDPADATTWTISRTSTLQRNPDGHTPAFSCMPPLSMTKQLTPATVAFGGVSRVRFEITNTNLVDVTGVALTDNLPAGMVVAPTPDATSTCGGTVGAVAGDDEITLTDGSVPATVIGNVADCVVEVNVRVTQSGTLTNTVEAGALTADAVPDSTVDTTATITVQPGPETEDETQRVPMNTATTIDVLDNDTPSVLADGTPGSWDPTSVVFPADGDQPPGATISADGKTLTVPNEGTYVIDDDGEITFTPVTGFLGAMPPVTYAMTDDSGNTVDATLTLTVDAIPIPTDDEANTPFRTPVTLPAATNDAPGDPRETLDLTSVVFPTAGQPAGSTVSADGKTLTVPGQGVYTVNDTDGTVTFTPDDDFVGPATPVTYNVQDSNGTTVDATLTPTVRPGPEAVDDDVEVDHDTGAVLEPLTNDTPGQTAAGGAGSFDVGSLVFTSPDASADGKTLTVPGEGTWSIQTDGSVLFDPDPDFVGTASADYEVTDSFGNTTDATMNVTVAAPPPELVNDADTTPHDTDITVDVLDNDTADQSTDLDPESVVLQLTANLPAGSSVTTDGKSLTVPGEGVYTVDPLTGEVTFNPEATFSGAATPVTYQAADENGATDTATITITVRPAPDAERDAVSTPLDTPVDIDVLANDTADAADPLDPTTVVFPTTGQPDGSAVSPDGRTLTVPGEGEYTIDTTSGVVTFTPEVGFTGPATEVTYQVADVNGTTTTAPIAVTVGEPPAPADDRAETPFGVTTAPIDVLANDVFATDDPVDRTSVVFPTINQPTGALVSPDGRTLTIPGTGVWTINPTTGAIVFDPADTFSGETPEVTYQVATDGGTTATAQLVVEVGDPVVADDETATTPAGAPVGIAVLDGDTSDTDAPIDATSVVFPNTGQPAGSVISDGGRTLTVPGQGVYTIDTTTGEMTFAPDPTFTGPATPVTYRVADSNGLTDDATVTVTVGPLPTAADDTEVTSEDVDVTVDVLDNDSGAPGVDLDPTTVVFPTANQPGTVSDNGRTLTVPGQGVYTIDPDTGAITFDPDAGYTGTTSEVTYQVADENGALTSAKLTIAVADSPLAGDDTARTPFGEPTAAIDLLANDSADSRSPLEPSSVVFTTTNQPAGATRSADGKTLTVPGEGEYVIDPTTGEVVFTPAPGFGGRAATPVTYRVSDSNGGTATATLTVTVGAAPVAAPDTARTNQDQPTAPIDLLGNDTVDPSTTKDPTSVVLLDDGLPAGSQLSTDGKTLTVPGEGEYVVNPTTGTVVFTPVAGFAGPVTPVGYTFADGNGATASSTLTVAIGAAPVALADTGRTPYETAVVVRPLANDSADPSRTLDVTSVVFPAAGQPGTVSNGGKTLTVDGEGVYTVNPDGSVTFTPDDGFSGVATVVSYQVSDSAGVTATSTITVTVGGPPVVADDTGRTTADQPVTVSVLGNDSADTTGDPDNALDPASVVFTAADQPDQATVSNGGKTLTVPGQGVYTVGATGAITFDPEPGFTGTATPVTYAVTDANGEIASAELAITVVGAADDTATTPYRTPVELDVLDNDSPGGTGESFDPDSVVFPTTGQPAGAQVSNGGRTLTVPGEGVYTVDPATGAVTFTPEDDFSGATSTVTYQATSGGTTVSATIDVTVGAPPVARDDADSTLPGVAVTVGVLGNDSADTTGDPDNALDPDSVVFTTADQPDGATVSDGGKTLTVPGQGTYRVEDTGEITFTPEADFEGVTDPVTYQVTDANGLTATAELTITVAESPVAAPDRSVTDYDTPVTLDVLANDTGDDLDPTSVVFPTAGQPAGATVSDGGKTLTVPGEGVYTIDPTTGQVTFDPDPAFSGRTTSPVTYQVADGNGLLATAQVTVDVGAGPDAVALPDRVQAEAGEPVTIDVLANDRPTPGESWVLDSLVFPTDGQPAGARVSADGRTLTVPGEGVYTINADGTITFTPEDGFSGETSPITYQVSDTAGEVLTATLAITMAAGEPSPSPDPSDRPNPDPSDPPSSGPGSPDGPGSGDDYWLPNTGGPTGALAVLGLVLIAGGAAVLTVRRRRRG